MLKDLLEGHPRIIELFNKDWLDSFDDDAVEWSKRRPLAQLLGLKEERAELILFALESLLNDRVVGIADSIRNLKSGDWFTADGAARELESYGILKRKGFNVIWKPVLKTKKRPDLKIQYKDHDVFIEIRVMHPTDKDRSEQKMLIELNSFVQTINKNTYIITTKKHKGKFTIEMLKPCCDFLTKQIKKGIENKINNFSEIFDYKIDEKIFVLCSFGFLAHPDKKRGYIGGNLSSRVGSDSGRLKNKVFEKLDRHQLNQSVREEGGVNILRIISDDPFGSYSLQEAILGTECLNVFLTEEGWKTIGSRYLNGVIHNEARAAILNTSIDAISFRSFGHEESLFNIKCPLSQEEINNFFV